ncbi:MAG: AraC family transcriptional regulator [Psychrilyobacter sp.]|uniref:AraC family transcriptional regulator n=1 Tax=Psychrilyobacter sp. TaxID=2586924 RepID=UPI003C7173F6
MENGGVKKIKTIKLKKEGFKSEHLISFERLNVNPIDGNIYITDIGFFPNTEGHLIERKNGSSENIFIFCTGGKGYIETNIKTTLEENQVYIIPKGLKHKYYSSKSNPWQIYWAHFNEKTPLIEINKKHNLKNNDLGVLLKILFNTIIVNLENSLDRNNIEFANSTFKYLLESTYWLNRISEQSICDNSVTEISKAITFINQNINRKIMLKDLSKILSCSNTYLNNLFNLEVKMSPLSYVNYRKIDYAESLLRMTTLSVTEISEKIGIKNPLYFSRIFKKKFGYSPRLYRNHLKDENLNFIK